MKKIFRLLIVIVSFLSFNSVVNAMFKDVDYSTNSSYKAMCKYNLTYDKQYVITIYEKTGSSGIFAVSYIEDGEEKGLEGTLDEINSTGNFSNTKSVPNVKAMGCPSGAYIDKSAVGWDEICFSNYFGKAASTTTIASNCKVSKNTGTDYGEDFVSSTLISDNTGVKSSGNLSGTGSNDDYSGADDCEGFLGAKGTKGTPAYYLHIVLLAMRYLAIILALVLSVVDFFKAVFSQDKDLLKKAALTAVKRVIFAVLVFFIPTVLEFVLGLLGAYTVNCV